MVKVAPFMKAREPKTKAKLVTVPISPSRTCPPLELKFHLLKPHTLPKVPPDDQIFNTLAFGRHSQAKL